MSPSSPIVLGRAQINGAEIFIELAEPPGHPAVVRVGWPSQPSLIPPSKFNGVTAKLPLAASPRHQSGSPNSGRNGEPRRVRAEANWAGIPSKITQKRKGFPAMTRKIILVVALLAAFALTGCTSHPTTRTFSPVKLPPKR